MRLLCIDGGGIRGLIPAQIIYRIEKDLGVNVREYFDMFSGTSAGSMIVAAMVYGNASGEDLVNKLLPNHRAKEIMKQDLWDKIFGQVQFKPKYTGKAKRKLIEDNVGCKTLEQTDKYVIIPSFNTCLNRTRFFKSWDQHHSGILVADVVDASSAAPSYYPSIKINCHDGEYYFIDGAVSVNNPTDSAYADLLEFSKTKEDVRILSLGTGYMEDSLVKENIQNWGGIQWATKGDMLDILMNAPEAMVDYRAERYSDALGHVYLRIQGTLDNGSLDDTSDENLAMLRKKGDEWFEENKEKLRNFFFPELINV